MAHPLSWEVIQFIFDSGVRREMFITGMWLLDNLILFH